MKRFTRLVLDVDSTSSTSEKVERMCEYFRQAPAEDGAWALALLMGARVKGSASSAALRDLVLEETGLPAWMLGACYDAVGDLSETVALLAPSGAQETDEPLHEVMEARVLPLARVDDAAKKRIIAEAWRTMGPEARFVYHKLIRGGFRIGVSRRLVTRAMAKAAGGSSGEGGGGGEGIEPEVMAARLAAYDAADVAAYRRILTGEDDGGQDATGAAGEAGDGPRRGGARLYPFFLAHPLNSPPAEALGEIGDWLVEWKWDGIRAQLLRRTDGVLLWSRGEEPVAGQFPQIAAAGMELEAGTVLDGEIVAWGDVGSGTEGVLPFARLQTHLNRTASNAAQGLLFATERPVFLAFDVLERGGEDLRGRTLRSRRAILEEVVADLGSEAGGVVRLSPAVRAESWEALAELREESRGRNVEGFVLKHRDSTYGVGRTKPEGVKAWWKWKVDPYSVDAVLLYAQPGSGRRAGLHTDYTFGLWETEGEAGAGKGELTPFAKAYSGLTNEEIERLDAWIRRHTVGRSGPIRSVAPEQVFEIGFEAIQPSKRHKSGIAVRFPRILRWRTDKRADEADTLETLRGLLRARGGEA